MQPNRLSITVTHTEYTTKDTLLIYFKTEEPLGYQSGQFITLHVPMGESVVKRSYSLACAPGVDKELFVCVKRTENPFVSKFIHEHFKQGYNGIIDAPAGNFIRKNEATDTVVFFAAGSGIVPIFSLIKHILFTESRTKVFLFYGNRTRDSIIFKKELDDYSNQYYPRLHIEHVLTQPDDTWVGWAGRINEAVAVNVIKKHVGSAFKSAHYYLCGPDGMMQKVKKALNLLSVEEKNVFLEKYTNASATIVNNVSAMQKSKVTVIDGHKKYQFEVAPNETILSVAQKLGYNLPYSCQAGMCTACMGKCTHGKVTMAEQDGLTDNEIKNGYVLTCVALPASEEVTIEL